MHLCPFCNRRTINLLDDDDDDDDDEASPSPSHAEEGSAAGTIGDNTHGDAGEAMCYQRSRHSQDTRADPFSKPPTERDKTSVSVRFGFAGKPRFRYRFQ